MTCLVRSILPHFNANNLKGRCPPVRKHSWINIFISNEKPSPSISVNKLNTSVSVNTLSLTFSACVCLGISASGLKGILNTMRFCLFLGALSFLEPYLKSGGKMSLECNHPGSLSACILEINVQFSLSLLSSSV